MAGPGPVRRGWHDVWRVGRRALSVRKRSSRRPTISARRAARLRPVPASLRCSTCRKSTAPAWLNGPGILYRLNYENPPRPQPYALSRWSGSPAALLTERLRNRFAAAATKGIVTGSDGVRADYLLRVELEDFSQSFDAPNASRVALQRAREPRQPGVARPPRAAGVRRRAGRADSRCARRRAGAVRGERRVPGGRAQVDGNRS